MTFRNQSQAHEICTRRELVREQVFILGRMGNAKQALAIIINKLGDIEEVPPVYWKFCIKQKQILQLFLTCLFDFVDDYCNCKLSTGCRVCEYAT